MEIKCCLCGNIVSKRKSRLSEKGRVCIDHIKNGEVKQIKIESPVHYQTVHMEKHNMTYCGIKDISNSVRVTNFKNKVTCNNCKKLF